MMRVVTIPALIFFMVMWRFPGIYAPRVLKWTSRRDQRVLRLYFQTLPADDEQEVRMEDLWCIKSPNPKRFSFKELQRRAQQLIEYNYEEWLKKPAAEREELEENLSSILNTIEDPRPEDEWKIFKKLLERHPEYLQDKQRIQNVVHKWYIKRVPHISEDAWTRNDKALLLYIKQVVQIEGVTFMDSIMARWLKLHPHQHITVSILDNKLKEIKVEKYKPTREEIAEAKRRYHEVFPRGPDDPGPEEPTRWTTWWPDERNAELLYVYERNKYAYGELYRNMERRWAQMYGYPSPVSGKSLMKRAKSLQRDNYEPKAEHMARAKARYERLPPLKVTDYKGKRIVCKPGPRRKLRMDTASTSRSSEQCQHNDYIATTRGPAGRGIHSTPEYHPYDPIRRDDRGGYHSEYPRNPDQRRHYIGSSRNSRALDLNLPHGEDDTLFDLNVPYHHDEDSD